MQTCANIADKAECDTYKYRYQQIICDVKTSYVNKLKDYFKLVKNF